MPSKNRVSKGNPNKQQSMAPLGQGVPRLSANKLLWKRGVFNYVKKGAATKVEKPKIVVRRGKDKVTVEDNRIASDISLVPQRVKATKSQNKTKLRKSITPGTVLILLEGALAGKRVVFLKQLDSGLLLVTGPSQLNGVSLTRVNQRSVIATSTKLDISSVSVPENVADALFKKQANKDENGKNVEAPISEERKKLNEQVDAAVLSAVQKVELASEYLKTPFAITSGVYPHELKF